MVVVFRQTEMAMTAKIVAGFVPKQYDEYLNAAKGIQEHQDSNYTM